MGAGIASSKFNLAIATCSRIECEIIGINSDEIPKSAVICLAKSSGSMGKVENNGHSN